MIKMKKTKSTYKLAKNDTMKSENVKVKKKSTGCKISKSLTDKFINFINRISKLEETKIYFNSIDKSIKLLLPNIKNNESNKSNLKSSGPPIIHINKYEFEINLDYEISIIFRSKKVYKSLKKDLKEEFVNRNILFMENLINESMIMTKLIREDNIKSLLNI